MMFQPIDEYTSFRAEFSVTDGDIIFHFFRTEEVNKGQYGDINKYWTKTFGEALSELSKSFFNADYPRLQAQRVYSQENPYTPDEPLDSWWFRAYGFGYLLDPYKKSIKFLELLDQKIDEMSRRTSE